MNQTVNVDHLIYTVPNLEDGIAEIVSMFGVRPVCGGSHPAFGTCNALLSLGNRTYLEIMAPDHSLPVPENGRLFEGEFNNKLTTWVLNAENIVETHRYANENGIVLGEILPGERVKPDGTKLNWLLTDPYAFAKQGAIPFLINWGDSLHPADTSPNGGKLQTLRIGHPEAGPVEHQLGLLGVEVSVFESDKVTLEASIETKSGVIVLR